MSDHNLDPSGWDTVFALLCIAPAVLMVIYFLVRTVVG